MPRPTSRELWAQKILQAAQPVGANRTLRLPAHAATQPVRRPFSGRVIGIDPSLRSTGVAIIEFAKNATPRLLHSENIDVSARQPMPTALAQIHQTLSRLVQEFKPAHAAIEQTIYVQNFQTAQILGAARGACITAVAIHQVAVFEYPPLRVKQAVVGVGRASKEQVLRTVRSLVGGFGEISYDEADAIAAALCHAFTWRDA